VNSHKELQEIKKDLEEIIKMVMALSRENVLLRSTLMQIYEHNVDVYKKHKYGTHKLTQHRDAHS